MYLGCLVLKGMDNKKKRWSPSSINSATFVYADSTTESGKRTVLRVRLFSLRGAHQTPIIRIVVPLLTVSTSQNCLSPYGLFILNRAGMHDYIHPIYPENEVQAAEGEYLMYRSYPEFIAKRLNMAKCHRRPDRSPRVRRTPATANDPLTN